MEKQEEHGSIEKLRQQLDMYERIFDSIYNGCMVTDADGFITHFNKPYGEFLGLDPALQIGKHCTDAIENSRMQIVAKTGKAEINQSHRIMGQDMIVQRIPIKRDGKTVAVFGQVMFKNVRDVGRLAKRLSLLESKVKLYAQEIANLRSTRYTFESIIGESAPIKALKAEALKATANTLTVLITGESGTGKELFAQAIHHGSASRMQPFVRINCAAIPRDLLESELFGYEKGAFTGASANGKPGKIELAHRGTLFLDEIGDLPLEMQPKLLRVLEEKEFERVGGTKPVRSEFRLVAATNQDLQQMINARRFRSDLYYRLNVIPLHIPPLRQRTEDILPIVSHRLRQMAQEMALPEIRIDREAEQVLLRYDWPGNVRELSNVLERTLSAMEGDTIRRTSLPFYLLQDHKARSGQSAFTIRSVQENAEQEAICMALKEAGYNKAGASRLLGIHRTLLYKKMKKYGISLTP
jgi:PAS domain S-box-containing protein